MKAIVAVYHNKESNIWGIGAEGTQPFALSADRSFFRETTKGHPVIVGHTTFLDFPNQKPLPHRRNIVLTSKNIQIEGAEIVHDIQSLTSLGLEDAFVIGGASIYKQLLPLCDEVYITHIYKDIKADVFFPTLHVGEWEVQTLATGHENFIEFKIEKFKRRETL